AADTLEVMRPERQVRIFGEFDEQRRTRLLELMAPDTAADLLGRLGPDTAKENLEHLPTAARDKILELLRYADDTAGGIMTNDIVIVEADLNVGQARSALREPLQR